MDMSTTTFISNQNPRADFHLAHALTKLLQKHFPMCRQLVFFCIGTPNISGDTLGPAIGSQLYRLHLPSVFVYGTEDAPVHALNLANTWERAKRRHPNACFIAIDASFGDKRFLGNICLERGPIYPGRGVGKDLPCVGDISITGILCRKCRRRMRELEKVGEEEVQRQANIITHGIFQSIIYFFL